MSFNFIYSLVNTTLNVQGFIFSWIILIQAFKQKLFRCLFYREEYSYDTMSSLSVI